LHRHRRDGRQGLARHVEGDFKGHARAEGIIVVLDGRLQPQRPACRVHAVVERPYHPLGRGVGPGESPRLHPVTRPHTADKTFRDAKIHQKQRAIVDARDLDARLYRLSRFDIHDADPPRDGRANGSPLQIIISLAQSQFGLPQRQLCLADLQCGSTSRSLQPGDAVISVPRIRQREIGLRPRNLFRLVTCPPEVPAL
jgi:hypothetical protein